MNENLRLLVPKISYANFFDKEERQNLAFMVKNFYNLIVILENLDIDLSIYNFTWDTNNRDLNRPFEHPIFTLQTVMHIQSMLSRDVVSQLYSYSKIIEFNDKIIHSTPNYINSVNIFKKRNSKKSFTVISQD